MTDFFFVHLFNDFSGSPRVLRDAIDTLADEKDYRLHVFSSGADGFLSGANAFYHTVPYHPHKNKYIQLFRYLLAQMFLFCILSWHLIISRLAGKKSVVLVNTLLPFGGHLAAKFFAHRDIAYLHETHVRPKLLMTFLTNVVSFCADNTLFVSHYVMEELDLKHHCMSVLYNGLRRDFVDFPCDAAQKFTHRQVLFVGSLKKYKGIFSFVELALKLPDFTFNALLNTSHAEFTEFQQYIQQHGASNLHVHRNPANIGQFYSEAFIVVNLSDPKHWVETFGLTLLEGMSTGTPVIAPPYGGPLELVDNSVGRLIEPYALDDISRFIEELSKDFEGWQTLSKNCLVRAQDFSADNYKKALINVLNISQR
ncbi:glycosyltransferase family 4 protein [Shewanella cyperi]|uniref:Glycosyltransferase family 4 protein n=1 Tax=Shewanella cyperi TaxID=2814292 RepID=A0A975AK77_9GAMM|nr:glycosyltransferase family 4 protein [Shewanella cyperi]QSX28908.1 glycosyltransferase family 4 protein [Shewanella cyperi]